MFYLNYQISVITMVLVMRCDVSSTICLTIIIQLGWQKMHAGIVLSAASVTKDPSWEVRNSDFFFAVKFNFHTAKHANTILDLATYSL
jgi:hypothetical protein